MTKTKLLIGAVMVISASLMSGCANTAKEEKKDAMETAEEVDTARHEIIEVDGDKPLEFGEKLDRPVVVDFWAEWCGPCRQFKPIFEQLSKEYGNRVTFYSVNVDKSPGIAATYGIHSIPTILFVDKNGNIDRQIGAMSYDEADAAIHALL
ncbi:MAG: thioredoxin [Pseudoflavonifractor sp.]|nr:thioredoxin [Pseudoflavonifractor sp.]